MVSQRFLYSLPQELANIVVLKEYLDNIKGVFLCYANIFKPLLSRSTFWLEFNSLGSESLPKLWKKFCFFMGRQWKWISTSKFPLLPSLPPCELSYISIVSPKWQEKHKSSLLHVSHWLSTEIRFGKYKNKISLYSAGKWIIPELERGVLLNHWIKWNRF